MRTAATRAPGGAKAMRAAQCWPGRGNTTVTYVRVHVGATRRRNRVICPIAGDLAKPETIVPLVDKVVAHFGTIDILVNNARATRGAPAEDLVLSGALPPRRRAAAPVTTHIRGRQQCYT
jgi:NAD(P)-dependent dehydrogenase (short-subunit alcohol dehydrogenase family)